MDPRRLLRKAVPRIILVLLGAIVLWPSAGSAQEEVASSIRRYRDRELSSGYYEDYEVRPRRQRPLTGIPEAVRRPTPASVYRPQVAVETRARSRQDDAHAGLGDYEHKRCEECHVTEAANSHALRGNITCRQCHGVEPIAGINAYFSPLNPIRRHAYVCAKCHEGANPSFATFVVHEPAPGSSLAKKTFPSLYYVFWTFLVLLSGVFVVSFGFSLTWIVKEFFSGKRKT